MLAALGDDIKETFADELSKFNKDKDKGKDDEAAENADSEKGGAGVTEGNKPATPEKPADASQGKGIWSFAHCSRR